MERIDHITFEVDGNTQHAYYGFDDTSDMIFTRLRLSPHGVVMDTLAVNPRSDILLRNPLQDVYKAEAKATFGPEAINKYRKSLMSFMVGQDVTIDQKQSLYRLNDFLDATVNADGWDRDTELSSDIVLQQIECQGLAAEAERYIDEGETIGSYLEDIILSHAFILEAQEVKYKVKMKSSDEPLHPHMPGVRVVAAAVLMTKIHLAVGALYAQGMEADDQLAMAAAASLDQLIRN